MDFNLSDYKNASIEITDKVVDGAEPEIVFQNKKRTSKKAV
jgi:hypothetical protein